MLFSWKINWNRTLRKHLKLMCLGSRTILMSINKGISSVSGLTLSRGRRMRSMSLVRLPGRIWGWKSLLGSDLLQGKTIWMIKRIGFWIIMGEYLNQGCSIMLSRNGESIIILVLSRLWIRRKNSLLKLNCIMNKNSKIWNSRNKRKLKRYSNKRDKEKSPMLGLQWLKHSKHSELNLNYSMSMSNSCNKDGPLADGTSELKELSS